MCFGTVSAFMVSFDHEPSSHELGDPQLLWHTLRHRRKVLDSWGGKWSDHPQDSAIHWTHPNISINMILSCTKKMMTNGAMQ